jgi:hypothetical protein
MASPLYYATFVEKKKAQVKVELSIVHPDVSDFGTDRLFAWKLLHEYVAGADDGTDVELASRYVKSVKLSPLKNGKVAKKGDDYFTVKRVGKKNPSVIYTIDVTDPALLVDISKGNSDEVYDYVEYGKGKALTAPPKGKPKKADAKPVTPATSTFADFRDAMFALLPKHSGSWSDYLLENGLLQRWSRDASDDEVFRWLECVGPYQACCAAAIALEKADDKAAAQKLMKWAEAKHAKDTEYTFISLERLVPAWWRFGNAKKAEAGYKFIAAAMKENGTDGNQAAHTLFTLAALGGQWEKALALADDCLAGGSYREDILVPGLMHAYVAGQTKIIAKIMKRWADAEESSKFGDFSMALARHVIERGEPGKYIELLLQYPKAIDDFSPAFGAYTQLEATDPKRAVALGEKLLANRDLHDELHQQALGVFVRHAPAKATAWVKANKKHEKDEDWIGSFAAAGLDVKKLLPKASGWGLRDVARHTPHRALALQAVELWMKKERDLNGQAAQTLAELGRRDAVENLLEKELAAIGKLATKERDLPCRNLAATAVTLGRPDIGFAAIKLPGPKMRQYSAGDMVRAALVVGDYTSALAALALVPDDDSNGRISTAVQGLRDGNNAIVDGPRATLLRVLDADYARALIATGDRAAVELFVALTKNAPVDDVGPEIDAFLEGRAFAPK